jgi:citrate synthase
MRYPRNNLEYVERFLHMMFEVPSEPYELNPIAAKALDLLFILHADHEQNASTSTVRLVGSTGANPYACVAAGVAALWGPAHGGANEAVLKMLAEIGSPEDVEVRRSTRPRTRIRLPPDGLRPPRVQELRPARHGHPRDDPRSAGRAGRDDPLLEVAMRLEQAALQDDYFVAAQALPERRFLQRHHLQGAGHPDRDVHRDVRDRPHRRLGQSHWLEQQNDPENRIGRPRQIYTGAPTRDYVGMGQR